MTHLTLALIFTAMSQEFGLPPHVLEALCFVESSHNIEAIHPDDGGTPSIGLCQVKLGTARWLGYKGDAEGLLDAKTNAYYAAKYLDKQRRRYKGSISKAIIAYNRGNAKNLTNSAYYEKVLKQYRLRSKAVTKQEYVDFFAKECAIMLEITKAKNADYTGNNADPFANFKAVELFGACSTEQGFMTRMTDKFMRINSFVQRGVLEVKDESVKDTLRDLAVYSILLNAYIESKRKEDTNGI